MIDAVALWEVSQTVAIGIVGSGLLAAIVSLFVSGWYRWTTTRAPPTGSAVLVGLCAVAGYWLYTAATTGAVVADTPLEHQFSAGYLLATVLVAGTVATAGSHCGDRIACQVGDISRLEAEAEPAAAIRAARLAVDGGLPETIDDADGYRPVDSSIRRALSGTIIRLPYGLSTSERRDRIERHLELAYDVDYVDVTMGDDGTVGRVLVGRRAPGLGSTLPPKTVGVAIRAASAPEASLGDSVEIWSTEEDGQLIATGTLRSTDGSIATVIVDADRAWALEDDEPYRLVTRPGDATAGYEFASTLRSLEETVVTVTIEPDGDLAGEFVGWLPGRVLVLDRDDEVLALPAANESLRPGDECWILGSPVELTAFDSAASAETVDDTARSNR